MKDKTDKKLEEKVKEIIRNDPAFPSVEEKKEEFKKLKKYFKKLSDKDEESILIGVIILIFVLSIALR